MNGLTYSGGASSGSDDLWFRVNDRAQWGGWVRSRITDPGDSPPTTMATQSTGLTNIFHGSDSYGDATISTSSVLPLIPGDGELFTGQCRLSAEPAPG